MKKYVLFVFLVIGSLLLVSCKTGQPTYRGSPSPTGSAYPSPSAIPLPSPIPCGYICSDYDCYIHSNIPGGSKENTCDGYREEGYSCKVKALASQTYVVDYRLEIDEICSCHDCEAPECIWDSDCDDGNPKTKDRCNERLNECTHETTRWITTTSTVEEISPTPSSYHSYEPTPTPS